jgi:hypothetical protein
MPGMDESVELAATAWPRLLPTRKQKPRTVRCWHVDLVRSERPWRPPADARIQAKAAERQREAECEEVPWFTATLTKPQRRRSKPDVSAMDALQPGHP